MGNDPEGVRLLELLRERVRLSRRSHRDLERELNLGHGTIGNIFRGRTELRFRHLSMLGSALGFEPADLLLEIYDARPPGPLQITREELRELIQEAVREELDRWNSAARSPAG
jgi:transcriptional regulator with XRE-family HTH domain